MTSPRTPEHLRGPAKALSGVLDRIDAQLDADRQAQSGTAQPIYGMNKMGYVETQWDGEPLYCLSAAQSYADTVDGTVWVSHDHGATWEPFRP